MCPIHDIDIFAHTQMPVHMMLSIGEMHQNGIQHHAPPDHPGSFILFTLILLCCLA